MMHIPYIIRVIKSRRINGRGMWLIWDRGLMTTKFRWGNLKERCHLENLNVDGSKL